MVLTPGNQPKMTLGEKLWQINWIFVLFVVLTASVGFAMLYSAANGSFTPWASRQMVRFSVGLVVMLCVAVTNIRFWLRYAYAIYALALALLVVVEFAGTTGMGARRWINLGVVTMQPSEVAKIAVILVLARYFYASRVEDVRRLSYMIFPTLLIAAPAALVLRQPDLGTAILIIAGGVALFFLAGVPKWIFTTLGLTGLGSIYPLWTHFLHDYQKRRLLTYLNPENDPLGAGYHIMQSKIALGSGGLFGKGFLQGTQSHLNFLPEMQTDFIFTMLAEEFGMVGGLLLLALYLLIIFLGFAIARRSRNQFGRLLAMGITATFFLNVFVNIAMVMGVLPVVGMPLPLISYGGTALVVLLFGFGLLLSVYVHRDVSLGPGAASGDV